MNFGKYLFVITIFLSVNASAYLYTKEKNMTYPVKNIQSNQKRIPPLDLAKPQNLQTATFALG